MAKEIKFIDFEKYDNFEIGLSLHIASDELEFRLQLNLFYWELNIGVWFITSRG